MVSGYAESPIKYSGTSVPLMDFVVAGRRVAFDAFLYSVEWARIKASWTLFTNNTVPTVISAMVIHLYQDP